MTNKDICIFKHEFFFLSNFYPCAVTIDGITYSSSEAAFQAQKTLDDEIKHQFIGITAKQAKYLGKRVPLRDDWEEVKLDVMYNVVKCKFIQNSYLQDMLLRTGERNLIEMNSWNDKFWGVNKSKEGENHLGKILMKIREELK